MKSIFILALVFASGLFAASAPATPPPAALPVEVTNLINQRLSTLNTQLKLTAEQSTSIHDLMVSHWTQRIAQFGSPFFDPSKMTASQKAEQKITRAQINEQVRKILTADQRIKLAELRASGVDCDI